MSGRLSIAGLRPALEVPMLPDSSPFVVAMPDGGTLTCVLSAVAPAAPTLAAPGIVQPGSWSLAATAPGLVQPSSWSIAA